METSDEYNFNNNSTDGIKHLDTIEATLYTLNVNIQAYVLTNYLHAIYQIKMLNGMIEPCYV